MKKYIHLLTMAALVAFSSFTLTSCKEEGCTDPIAANYDEDASKDDGSCIYDDPAVMMHIHNEFGSDEFSLNTEYQTADGRAITFSIARFYISNIRLVTSAGVEEPVEGPGYVQFKAGTEMYSAGSVAPGNYSSIRFDIGVDSTANFGDPAMWEDTHPLSNSSETFDHWSWSMGYLFIRMEGQVDGSAAGDEAADDNFIFHVGTMGLLRSVEIPYDLTVDYGTNGTVHLAADIQRVLNGIDWAGSVVTHTGNNMPLAMQVADNAADALEAK